MHALDTICFTPKDSEELRAHPFELSQVANHKNSKAFQNYLSFYKLHFENAQHAFGWLSNEKHQLAVHHVKPDHPSKGTIIHAHGYLDHNANFSNIWKFALAHEYEIIAYDHPGHGLSSGQRGHVDSFSDYALALDTIISYAQTSANTPIMLIGQSTGCSAIIEYLINKPSNVEINKVCLLAPLVRNNHWMLATASHSLLNRFVRKVPRFDKLSTQNREYYEHISYRDPLQVRIIPLTWVDALMRWNEKLPTEPTIEERCLIIQGDRDQVVDWKYNLSFLKQLFSNCEVRMLKQAFHVIPSEPPAISDKMFRLMQDFMG